MRKYYLFVALLSGFLFAFPSWGDEAQIENTKKNVSLDSKITTRAWQESIVELKQSAEVLLKENDKLTSENSQLFSELSSLQKAIEGLKEENTRLLSEPTRLNKLVEIENAKNKVFEKTTKDLEKAITPLTQKRTSLEQRWSLAEGQQKSLEKQVNDLNAKKIGLTVDLKLKQESAPQADIEKLKSDVKVLQNLLAQNEKKTQQIEEAVRKRSQDTFSEKILEKLKKENADLSAELQKTKNKQKVFVKEVENFGNKSVQLKEVSASEFSKKMTQKIELENQSKLLESRVARMRKAQETPVPSAEVNMDELRVKIDQLEKERQDLENRIFDLTEATLVLKRENTMIEALLNVQSEMGVVPQGSRLREGVWASRSVAEAMAYAYASQGMYKEAAREYEQTLKQGGDKKDIYFNLGYVYFKMGHIEDAIKSYKNVLKIDPRDYEAKRNIARLREELSHLNKQNKK